MVKDDFINSKVLNEIINKTVKSIEKSKNEMFDISENLRKEANYLKDQVKQVQKVLNMIIDEVDKLELEEKRGRAKLAMVSKNFDRYSQEEIKQAYEQANELKLKLMLKRKEEKDTIKKRNELQMRFKKSLDTLAKADKLTSQIGVAMNYLRGNLSDIVDTVDDMSKKRFLGVKIIKAQEEEKQRVARDIHDGPAQLMANVVLKAELCEKLISLDKERVTSELKSLKEIVRDSLTDIRRIIYDLRPMSLDDLGLIHTVKRYSYDFSQKTNIEVIVKVLKNEREIPDVVQIAVFRIIQEALNNVRKHSQASLIRVNIEVNRKNINVIVKDNGKGFNMSEILEREDRKDSGFGIIGMKERVEFLDGDFKIKSAIGKGTRITLTIPINKEDN